jgi:hypothetical protein
MARDRTSWQTIAALREAIRRDALELRDRGGAMYDRCRKARAAQGKWLGLVALGRALADVFWRRPTAKGAG